MPTETLLCANGHTFEREIKRGRRPRLCPACAQEEREAPQTTRSPSHALRDEVSILLPRVQGELHHKLRYMYDKFESGNGDQYNLETYRMLVREAQRSVIR